MKSGFVDKCKEMDYKLSYELFKRYPRGQKYQRILSSLEWSCHGIPWFIVVIASLYLYPGNKVLSKLLVGLVMDVMVVGLIKATVRRRRPVYRNQDDQFIVASVDKHSFPSGHASRAIYVALLTHSLYGEATVIGYLVGTWAMAVAASRIFLGRHHVFDVAAGFVVAYFVYTSQFLFGGLISSLILPIFTSTFVDPSDPSDS
ncbi:polyisoprenoid diphosphate/phosphate phosphohydrolase PLPP6-like [Brevipalpus obovatus]|uniref:polyisoprenoid diphosphate/phosphate phosphohydrolase PLPP6-like n=1 Tax=Brevipalpus obovatus TaxID=246614 RepID=UPI003D9F4167